MQKTKHLLFFLFQICQHPKKQFHRQTDKQTNKMELFRVLYGLFFGPLFREKRDNGEHVGAELAQAQFKLGLDFTLIFVYLVSMDLVQYNWFGGFFMFDLKDLVCYIWFFTFQRFCQVDLILQIWFCISGLVNRIW